MSDLTYEQAVYLTEVFSADVLPIVRALAPALEPVEYDMCSDDFGMDDLEAAPWSTFFRQLSEMIESTDWTFRKRAEHIIGCLSHETRNIYRVIWPDLGREFPDDEAEVYSAAARGRWAEAFATLATALEKTP